MATGRLPDPNSSPLTAKGDLYTYSTVPAKLAVGSNGETLVADSSATTGLRYNPQNVLANPVINGGLDIWQRGTSFSTPVLSFVADRFQFTNYGGTATTVSRQTTGDTTNLPNIQYAMRCQRNSGQTGTSTIYLTYTMESVNSIPFAGKTITYSFYARAGANYSASSSILRTLFLTGTGTDQNINNGFTGSVSAIDQNTTLTTTWQRFAYTATLNTNITQMGFYFEFVPTGTAGTNDWFEVTGFQVDVGTYTASTAPTFRRSGGTLAGELQAAQRYYYRVQNDGTGSYSSMGVAYSATGALVSIPLKATMRVSPTAVDFSSIRLYDGVNAAGGISAVTLSTGSPNVAVVDCTSTGMTTYRPYYILGNTLPSFIGFSAEL